MIVSFVKESRMKDQKVLEAENQRSMDVETEPRKKAWRKPELTELRISSTATPFVGIGLDSYFAS